jgi:hypothetical protein
MALSGKTDGISRLATYVRAGAVFRDRDVPVPAWAPRWWAAPLWAFRTTGCRALTVVVPCINTGTMCSKEMNDT